MARQKSNLKARNLKWITALALLDVALIIGFALPQAIPSSSMETLLAKLIAPSMLPLLVLIVVSVLPTAVKFRLLYWRGPDGVPGASAFTVHGPADPRVDMVIIERRLGSLPSAPADQNKIWYRLYRQVDSAPAVEHAHQLSLMFREMVAMSLVLATIVPIALWIATADVRASAIALAISLAQYLVTMIAGRSAGARFASNVFAEHSAAVPPTLE